MIGMRLDFKIVQHPKKLFVDFDCYYFPVQLYTFNKLLFNPINYTTGIVNFLPLGGTRLLLLVYLDLSDWKEF